MNLRNAVKQQDVFRAQYLPLIKVTVAPLVKKFSVYAGILSIHNFLLLDPSLSELIQSTISDPTPLKSFLILSSNLSLRLLSGLIPLDLLPNSVLFVFLPYQHMPYDLPNIYSMLLSFCYFIS